MLSRNSDFKGLHLRIPGELDPCGSDRQVGLEWACQLQRQRQGQGLGLSGCVTRRPCPDSPSGLRFQAQGRTPAQAYGGRGGGVWRSIVKRPYGKATARGGFSSIGCCSVTASWACATWGVCTCTSLVSSLVESSSRLS